MLSKLSLHCSGRVSINTHTITKIHSSAVNASTSKFSNIPELQGMKDFRDDVLTSNSCEKSDQEPMLQGLQGREHQFNSSQSRYQSTASVDSTINQGVQVEFRDFKKFKMPYFKPHSVPIKSTPGELKTNYSSSDCMKSYNMGNPVSLHSTMQSNVPFVAPVRILPNHLKMSTGSTNMTNNYTNEQVNAHTTLVFTKSLSTSCRYASQSSEGEPEVIAEDPNIEGVQVNYKYNVLYISVILSHYE